MGIDHLAAAVVLFVLLCAAFFFIDRRLAALGARVSVLEQQIETTLSSGLYAVHEHTASRLDVLEPLIPFLLVATPFDPDALDVRHVTIRTVFETHEAKSEPLQRYRYESAGVFPSAPTPPRPMSLAEHQRSHPPPPASIPSDAHPTNGAGA